MATDYHHKKQQLITNTCIVCTIHQTCQDVESGQSYSTWMQYTSIIYTHHIRNHLYTHKKQQQTLYKQPVTYYKHTYCMYYTYIKHAKMLLSLDAIYIHHIHPSPSIHLYMYPPYVHIGFTFS